MSTTHTTRIKICGIFREADVAAVNRALPDYVGFVFAPSTRRVTPEHAASLRAQLDERIVSVGVFVEEAPERIAELYDRGLFAAAQLHGAWQPEQIGELRQRCGANLTIIRAVAVELTKGTVPNCQLFECGHGVAKHLEKVDNLEPSPLSTRSRPQTQPSPLSTQPSPLSTDLLHIADEVDYPLFDYREPGSGRTFDWSCLAGIRRPYFLAGGIGLGNIEEALELKPYCIDVSSGAETDGVKDSQKINELVKRVRQA
ncbi:MAG: phosphoribosylanthranilate isomerase [Coriobacteriales bacterium]|jgi:phosphoribosylanthranilate isomerase|nr:phosphoribosylanthranilate isomerase [Coriobacteriales bacterium]